MIQIREAIPSDALKIIDFQIKMALETENMELSKSVVEPGVQAVFQDKNKGRYFVAVAEGLVVGSLLTTYEWSDWRNGTILWIQSVFVDAQYRGKGIYRKMYSHIKEMIENHPDDYKGIRLYVDKTNESAQSVYQKLGMIDHHYDMYEWMND